MAHRVKKSVSMKRFDGRTLLALAATALATRAIVRRVRQESLEGEVAVITGASRGLGLAIARELAAEGCRLILCARDEEELRRAAEEVAHLGADVVPVVCDVSAREEVDRLIETATSYFGRIDILVNNAGIIEVGPAGSMTLDDFATAMDTMYWGLVHTTMAALPAMKARRHGRIVNITSIGGKVGIPHLLPYSGAKFAAVGFSEGLHAEVAKDGVVVTTVVPGLMRTGSYRQAFFKGDVEKEFRWFALASTMPMLSMSATRAARKIVKAMKRRAGEITLSAPAKVGARLNGLMPAKIAAVLGIVNALLPHDQTPLVASGADAEALLDSPLVARATILGRRAGAKLNQR